ncbi:MAG: hypothetical protein ISP91_15685 [Pseudomonadales bacterium]|nr:hypothetical protein [Pseudomonadales bacterium]
MTRKTNLVVIALLAALVVVTVTVVLNRKESDPQVSPESAQQASPVNPREAARETASEPLSLMDLTDARIGESFSLYIPQEERILVGAVERTHVSKAGNRVLQGRIQDGDRSYSFVVTVGRHQTFGSIQTSRDRYQFELKDGEGELIAQSTLNKMRDFSEPDYVIPQRREPEKLDEE